MGINCGVCLARDGENCPCPTNHDSPPEAKRKLALGRALGKARLKARRKR